IGTHRPQETDEETRTMAKLTKMVSAIGSLKDLNAARAEFDDASKTTPAEAAFPPADIRPSPGGARTVFLRVTNKGDLAEAASQPSSQGDTFAVIHVPAAGDFAAVLVFNPSTQIESGQTFASIADEGGWPVIVAMAEEFLGIRVDHIAELDSEALGNVIDSWDHCRSTVEPPSVQARVISSRARTPSTVRLRRSSPPPTLSMTPARPAPAISVPCCAR